MFSSHFPSCVRAVEHKPNPINPPGAGKPPHIQRSKRLNQRPAAPLTPGARSSPCPHRGRRLPRGSPQDSRWGVGLPVAEAAGPRLFGLGTASMCPSVRPCAGGSRRAAPQGGGGAEAGRRRGHKGRAKGAGRRARERGRAARRGWAEFLWRRKTLTWQAKEVIQTACHAAY